MVLLRAFLVMEPDMDNSVNKKYNFFNDRCIFYYTRQRNMSGTMGALGAGAETLF
jgi:hypothetical protein